MPKTAIYCRVSTQMQSTDRQKEELLKYAKNSLHVEIHDDYIFTDIVSGFSTVEERTQYMELKRQIADGSISCCLFSEMTRLGRNTNELLTEIKELQKLNCDIFFQKQNLWVRSDKSDLGSEILLHVLAVVASYEVELFAQRGLSGKMQKISQGGSDSDSRSLGYYSNEEKKIAICDEEAELVKRIFELYANGKSTMDICDILNSEKIPTKSSKLVDLFKSNRKRKKLKEKDYSWLEESEWRCSTISRILHNELYIGRRHIVLHEPDPTNKIAPKQRKNRTIAFEYDEQIENLRIIDDELWCKVQTKLNDAPYNKNNAIKHENLLKDKLICGECGSNFTVGLSHDTAVQYDSPTKTYRCYGLVKRIDKPKTCTMGMQTRQARLDGLVLELSMLLFAKKNFIESVSIRRSEIKKKIDELQKQINAKQDILKRETADYRNKINILASNKIIHDDIIADVISNTQSEYIAKEQELSKGIKKHTKDIVKFKNAIESIDAAISRRDLTFKISNLEREPDALKSLVEDFVDSITSYRIHKLWNLIIVKYKTGEEMWGTMKTARYKKEEVIEIINGMPLFYCWKIDNSTHSLSYDKNLKLIHYNGMSINAPSIRLKKGDYTFEQFDTILKSDTRHRIHSYMLYDYEAELERVRKQAKVLNQEENSGKDF